VRAPTIPDWARNRTEVTGGASGTGLEQGADAVRLLVAGLIVLLVAMAAPGSSAAQTAKGDGFLVELAHPQSDDQGHYVRVSHLTRATVFGLAAPADKVAEVSVNGRAARLFPARMLPFGATADTEAVEFRATIEVHPETTLTVAIRDASNAVHRRSLEPDAEATVSRLRQLATESPDDPRSHCRLGTALKDGNRLKEAVDEFTAGLERKSDCAYMRVELGRALVAIGRPEDAIREFALATEIDPHDPMAWLNLGLVHARYTRNTSEAVRCFRRYLELEPSSSIADKIRRYLDRTSP
jgi:Flp pilus assembly protein TadD